MKHIAFTFDDGPSPSTGNLLDVLEKAGVKATFFVNGANCAGGQGINSLKRIAACGHEIGSHGFNHFHWGCCFDKNKIKTDFERNQNFIKETAGITPALFRHPYNFSNAVTLEVLKELGLRNVGVGVDTKDYSGVPAEGLANLAACNLKGNGLFTFHDLPASNVIKALPRIVRTARDGGFGFVTVSGLVPGRGNG